MIPSTMQYPAGAQAEAAQAASTALKPNDIMNGGMEAQAQQAAKPKPAAATSNEVIDIDDDCAVVESKSNAAPDVGNDDTSGIIPT